MTRIGDDVHAVEQHAAGGGLDDRRHDVHEGGLAGPVRSEQSEHPFWDLQIDAAEGADGAGVDLDEALDRQGCRVHEERLQIEHT